MKHLTKVFQDHLKQIEKRDKQLLGEILRVYRTHKERRLQDSKVLLHNLKIAKSKDRSESDG